LGFWKHFTRELPVKFWRKKTEISWKFESCVFSKYLLALESYSGSKIVWRFSRWNIFESGFQFFTAKNFGVQTGLSCSVFTDQLFAILHSETCERIFFCFGISTVFRSCPQRYMFD
jgi:hypothetical protein